MRISDVLAALKAEFPAVSHSKLRFLEEQGLVEPVRTASGYRQYSPADIERIRFVLVEQRDRYLPLKVIKDKLAELDAGAAAHDQPLIPHLVTRDGVSEASSRSMHLDAVAQRSGISVGALQELVDNAVITVDADGRINAWDEPVITACAALQQQGLDARQLRAIRAAANRQIDVIDQLVRAVGRTHSPAAQAKRSSMAVDLGEMCAKAYTAMLRQGIVELG
ncbi:MerR family transcriptional regulator [Rarobacter faecitabidus]|nr:MerR family transcriptional regulator [Rarobacter faecitabidus]